MSATLKLEELTGSGYNGDILLKPSGDVAEDSSWNLATRPWGCQNKKDPKLALRPKTVEDVSKAVVWLRYNELDFAVRSGGTGQSQSDQVILDMGHFNKLEIDEQKKLVTLGPGQTWRSVYEKLAATSVTVLGGRVGYVGVGGFLTGGGLSYLTSIHGIATKSVVDFQLVLADGRVIWTSEDPDLAQAVRGAGFSFGVVTEIIIRAISKPPSVYAGYLLYTVDKLEALARHVEKLSTDNEDPKIGVILALFHAPGLGRVVCLNPFVVGPEGQDVAQYVKQPDKFGWAWDYSPIYDGSGVMTYEEAAFNNEKAVFRPSATTLWQIGGAIVASLTPSIIKAGADWATKLQSRPDGERFYGAGVFFMPLTKNSLANTSETKGVWPPPGCSSLSAISIIIDQANALPGHAEENDELMREGVRQIQEAARGEGIEVIKNYPNYLIRGSRPEEFYDEKTLEFLRTVKAKYDPTDIFNKGIRIGL